MNVVDLPEKEQRTIRNAAFQAYADNVLRDDRVTAEAEAEVSWMPCPTLA